MLFFLEAFIDNISNYKAELKDKLHVIEKDIFYLNEDVEIHTVNMNMIRAHVIV